MYSHMSLSDSSKKAVKFYIDQISRTMHISKAPYRMGQAELAKVNGQLKELED